MAQTIGAMARSIAAATPPERLGLPRLATLAFTPDPEHKADDDVAVDNVESLEGWRSARGSRSRRVALARSTRT